jgi:putative membrane protein
LHQHPINRSQEEYVMPIRSIRRLPFVLLVILVFGALSACSSDDTAAPAGTGGGASGADGGVQDRLTDAQVVGVMHAANMGEVQEAKIAETKAVDPDVLSFAMDMDAAHTAADQAMLALSMNGGTNTLAPADSPTSQVLTATAMQKIGAIQSKTGRDFDQAYMNDQIEMHSQVLDLLMNVLVPSTTDSMLKAQLTMAVDAVTMHLAHARTVQQKVVGVGNP